MVAEKEASPMEEDKPASPNGSAEAEKDAAGGPKKDRKPGAEAVKEEDGEEDLSEEDAALKEQLELLVERVQDADAGVQKLALDTIRSEIRSATSSMTSVPKPLKFLRPHYGTLKEFFARMPAGDNKVYMADVLSVLAMTMAEDGERECLAFKLQGSRDNPEQWGHEYVRHLCGEIGAEHASLVDAGAESSTESRLEDLARLVDQIVPFLVSSNAEPEAVDLLMEVDALSKLPAHANGDNYERICNYLKSCAAYVPEPDDQAVLSTALQIYRQVSKWPQALGIALRLNDAEAVQSIYSGCPAGAEKLQLAFDLARSSWVLNEDVEKDETLLEVLANRKQTDYFVHLATDLQVMEPKQPEDIYKSHLVDNRSGGVLPAAVDSARTNLAATFVNAFVNAGFRMDKLLNADEEKSWIYGRNKDHGMMSAAASLGMIMMWDVDGALPEIDRFLYHTEEYVKAGMLLAVGVVSSTVRHDVDPALALLSERVTEESAPIRHGSISGLGIAYAGTSNEQVKDVLVPVLLDAEAAGDTAALAALSLGLVFAGTADEDLAGIMVQALSERADAVLSPGDGSDGALLTRLMPLGLGLLFLRTQEAADAVAESLKAFVGEKSVLARVAAIALEACAYAGTGNVLKIQRFLTICGRHPSADAEAAAAADAEAEAAAGSAAAAAAASTTAPSGNVNGTESEGSSGSGAGGVSDNLDGALNSALAGNLGSGAAAEAGSSAMPTTGDSAPAVADTSEGAGAANGTDAPSAADRKKAREEEVAASEAEQAIAVLGLALVAMGEELGTAMTIRAFGHLQQYGDLSVRRAMPLALGLLSISNPDVLLTDTLSKLTHESDPGVYHAAVLGLGLIGAGTNNSRIAGLLRSLSAYFSKDAAALFVVRLAQGLLHTGKGLITLSPYPADSKALCNRVSLGGLVTVLFACLDMKATILGKSHYLLFFLSLAMTPRMVTTVDEDLKPLPVLVRVGQAVDTVGQAGRPKRITGFQTHTTPILLASGERAELATDEYLASASVLEGVVVLTKNPDWVDVENEMKAAVASGASTSSAPKTSTETAAASPAESSGAA
ncbi:hypothetical protein MMPV_009858 [Pyropia vietnamensis]